MAFQKRNGTCGMKQERSGWNLAEKSGTDRDLKWDKICSVLFRFLNWYGTFRPFRAKRNGIDNLGFYLLIAELVWVVQPCLLLLQAMTMLLVVLDASWFRAIWSIWLVFYLTLLFFALFKWNMFNLQVLSPMPVFAGVKEGIWFLGCGLLWPTTCLLFAVFDGVIVARCCLGFCLLWLAFCCYCCVGLPEFIASDVGSSLTSTSSPNDYMWALWNYYSGCPHFRPSDPLVSSAFVADVMLLFMLDGLTLAPLP
jgi:hypothetical protein